MIAEFPERLGKRIMPEPNSGCWLWLGRRVALGYGLVVISHRPERQRSTAAHRIVHEHLVGPIPDGLILDHLCRVPACVNPAHLEPVTHRVNIMRGEGLAAMEAARSHCFRGHEYTDETLVYMTNITGNRFRECILCRRIRKNLYRARIRATGRKPS